MFCESVIDCLLPVFSLLTWLQIHPSLPDLWKWRPASLNLPLQAGLMPGESAQDKLPREEVLLSGSCESFARLLGSKLLFCSAAGSLGVFLNDKLHFIPTVLSWKCILSRVKIMMNYYDGYSHGCFLLYFQSLLDFWLHLAKLIIIITLMIFLSMTPFVYLFWHLIINR